MGLYVVPHIPRDKVNNALRDYASTVEEGQVLALYDATLIGNGKDGAVFTADRLVFQNNNMEPVHEVRYEDVVHVVRKRRLMGGQRLVLSVNRGRATFDLALDFSGRPKACPYVARFLQEAMMRPGSGESGTFADSVEGGVDPAEGGTDPTEVRKVLDALHARGVLSTKDRQAMLNAIGF